MHLYGFMELVMTSYDQLAAFWTMFVVSSEILRLFLPRGWEASSQNLNDIGSSESWEIASSLQEEFESSEGWCFSTCWRRKKPPMKPISQQRDIPWQLLQFWHTCVSMPIFGACVLHLHNKPLSKPWTCHWQDSRRAIQSYADFTQRSWQCSFSVTTSSWAEGAFFLTFLVLFGNVRVCMHLGL